MKDVRKIVMFHHELDECNELKTALLSKIQQDSLLIEKQTELNKSLKDEILLQQEINNNHEQINTILKSQISQLQQKNKKNWQLFGGVSIGLLIILLLK